MATTTAQCLAGSLSLAILVHSPSAGARGLAPEPTEVSEVSEPSKPAPTEAKPQEPPAPAPAPASTPALQPRPDAPGSGKPPQDKEHAFTTDDAWITPGPGRPATPPAPRRHIREAPLAGAEASWGPPGGQMPEYVEIPEPIEPTGPPPRGTPRIIVGAVLGPVGLGLLVLGIVNVATPALGQRGRLSPPLIGGGLVTAALGIGLLADGILRRQRFMRWQARGGQVTLAPQVWPGPQHRSAGLQLGVRF